MVSGANRLPSPGRPMRTRLWQDNINFIDVPTRLTAALYLGERGQPMRTKRGCCMPAAENEYDILIRILEVIEPHRLHSDEETSQDPELSPDSLVTEKECQVPTSEATEMPEPGSKIPLRFPSDR